MWVVLMLVAFELETVRVFFREFVFAQCENVGFVFEQCKCSRKVSL